LTFAPVDGISVHGSARLALNRLMGCESQWARHSTAPKHGRGNLYPRKRSPNGSQMSMVFVVDQQQRPCSPIHPGRARHLLNRGRAAVFRRYPFTLILQEDERGEEGDPLRLKIDPGSTTTGLALVNDATGQVVWAGELTHRGHGNRAGRAHPLLPSAPAQRRLPVHERSGAASPGLKAGVSAPQMRWRTNRAPSCAGA
jgi:RRXRR protein